MTRTDNDARAVPDDELDLDDFLPYLLNRISNRLNLDLSEELRTIGATLPQWRVLAVLHIHNGRSIGELSVYTVIEQSTLSRIVDRMAQDGLVERRPAAADGRIVEVFMSDRGEALFRRILPMARRHYRRAIAGIEANDLQALLVTLHRILDNVRATPYP